VALLGVCFFLQVLFAVQTHFTTLSLQETQIFVELAGSFGSVGGALNTYQTDPNMKSLGLLLFTDYFFYFVVCGYILLLPMVGAIVLTLQKTFGGKSQYISKQVLQDFNSAITLK
jgi:NADH:ubiquinone oxidoreductase subunit 6 (subunit J)